MIFPYFLLETGEVFVEFIQKIALDIPARIHSESNAKSSKITLPAVLHKILQIPWIFFSNISQRRSIILSLMTTNQNVCSRLSWKVSQMMINHLKTSEVPFDITSSSLVLNHNSTFRSLIISQKIDAFFSFFKFNYHQTYFVPLKHKRK